MNWLKSWLKHLFDGSQRSHRSRLGLLVFYAILFLAMGFYLLLQFHIEWSGFLGLGFVMLGICVGTLAESLQSQHKRIAELERKLSENQSAAEPTAAANGGLDPGPS